MIRQAQDAADGRSPARVRLVTVRAQLSRDSHSLLRILTDAARFGLVMRRITVQPEETDADAQILSAVFEVPVTSSGNAAELAFRLSRHVGVSELTCRML